MIQKKWLLRLIRLMLIVSIGFFLARGYVRLTDNFSTSILMHDLPHDPQWDVAETIATLPAQSFHYIGKGSQSYVFLSEDGKYVIKFFKKTHLQPSWFITSLPEWGFLKSYRNSEYAKKNLLLQNLFSGYLLAYKEMPEETGIVYIHFNPTHDLHRKLAIYDKIGHKWDIDLDSYVFVVQKTAKTTKKVIELAIQANNFDLVQKRITQIFGLYLNEYSKGIYDRDHGVLDNTGFIGDKPVHIDVGKLTKDDRMKDKKYYGPDLILIANKFEVWFRRSYPTLYPEMKHFLEQEMSRILGEKFTFEKS